MDIKQLASSDYFFYYDKIDYKDMCQHDLMEIAIQPKKSMYFYRDYGAGIKSCENFPVGLLMQIAITYGIANSVAKRNLTVTDGANSYPDRRIAVSQGSIDYEMLDIGAIDIRIYYYLYADLTNKQAINLSTGTIQ
jgi:hypothetical protein